MSMKLDKVREVSDPEPTFPSGLEIKALDLDDATALSAVFEVIKLAFGQNQPSLEAWKVQYAQQPRFAPELNFVAWDGDEPVAAIALERVLEGEGGGESEVPRLNVNESSPDFVFPAGFDERKARIEQEAAFMCVFSVATKAECRSQGTRGRLAAEGVP